MKKLAIAFLVAVVFSGCRKDAPQPLPAGVQVEDVASDVPQFKRQYTRLLQSKRGLKMVVTIRSMYYSFHGPETSTTGELDQENGKWVLFEPESPADKILDPTIIQEVESVCKSILADDSAWRKSEPLEFKDESGTVWRRVQ